MDRLTKLIVSKMWVKFIWRYRGKIIYKNLYFFSVNCILRKILRNYLIEIALWIHSICHTINLQQTVPKTKEERQGGRGGGEASFSVSIYHSPADARRERFSHCNVGERGKRNGHARGNDLWHITQHDENTPGRSSHVTQRVQPKTFTKYCDCATLAAIRLHFWREIYIISHVCPIVEKHIVKCRKVQSRPDREIGSNRASYSGMWRTLACEWAETDERYINGFAHISARLADLFDFTDKEEHESSWSRWKQSE